METNLLDKMLTTYSADRTPVTVVLQNRGRISGTIRAFDSYVIIMEGRKSEIIYRHAISSLLPSIPEQTPPAPRKQEQAKPAPGPAKYPQQAPSKHRSPKPAPRAATAPSEPGLNNTMKEGLLKWMKEQKAAK